MRSKQCAAQSSKRLIVSSSSSSSSPSLSPFFFKYDWANFLCSRCLLFSFGAILTFVLAIVHMEYKSNLATLLFSNWWTFPLSGLASGIIITGNKPTKPNKTVYYFIFFSQ